MEAFAEQIRELLSLLDKNKSKVANENETKMALIVPFLKVLGYEITNPDDIIPEYSLDVGKKWPEKIDYALKVNGEIVILIEVKSLQTILDRSHRHQLKSYFHDVCSKGKPPFGILTNGIEYQFFADFDKENIMDENPFITIKLETNLSENDIIDLYNYRKNYFRPDVIREIAANELKDTKEISDYLNKQIDRPEEDFIKFILKKTIFKDPLTKKRLEKYSPIISKALRTFANRPLVISPPKRPPDPPYDPCYRFWDRLLDYAKTKTDLHAEIKPKKYEWLGRSIHGLWFAYVVRQHKSKVEFWIDKGKDAEAENKEIFDKLITAKDDIEKAFGEPLEWNRMDGKKACYIRKQINLGGYRDEQTWPKVHEAMVDAMVRLHEALSPHIQYLGK